MKKPYFKLKAYLVENNIKQNEVAKYLDMNKSTFSRKLNRKYGDFTIEEVRKICNRYNLDANIYFLA